MKKTIRLKKWPLVAITAALLGVSAVTTTALASTTTRTVKANILNIRMGPGMSYSITGQMAKGSQMTIIGERNSWYEVRLAGNKVGWVASWLVQTNDADTSSAQVAVAQTAVRVHQYASSTSSITGTLGAGDSTNVVYQQGAWSQIVYKGTAAWVATQYLTFTGQTAAVVSKQDSVTSTSTTSTAVKVSTTTSTYLREAGGVNAKALEALTKGTNLTVLNQDGEWYHVKTAAGKIGYVASWVVATPSTNTTKKSATSLSEATIVIDPGHGGSDAGALSTSGKYEKTYTLATAKAVAAQLRAAGANVIMTRSTDTFVDLAPRPTIAAKVQADAFISIHFDSTPDANEASGHTTYYYSDTKDLKLAKSLQSSLTGLPLSDRGVQYGNYEVLRDNKQPSVLLELGYINSNKDFKQIESASYQSKVATDIANGLRNYFK